MYLINNGASPYLAKRDRQRQTETDKDRQRQTKTDKDRQRQRQRGRWAGEQAEREVVR
jgi:hypothetical protein